ncbi:MAG: hypothetical protein RRB13_06665 [bacterium]|nr:hypothetical protein [bacterium]
MKAKNSVIGALIILFAGWAFFSLSGSQPGLAERRSEPANFRPTKVEALVGPQMIGQHRALGLRLHGAQGYLDLKVAETLITQAAETQQQALAPQGSFDVSANWAGQHFLPSHLRLTINQAKADLSMLDIRLQGELKNLENPAEVVSIDLPLLLTTPN